MIKECNFKNKVQDGYQCSLSSLLYETDSLTNGGVQHAKECDGEDNCILYQIYKQHEEENYIGGCDKKTLRDLTSKIPSDYEDDWERKVPIGTWSRDILNDDEFDAMDMELGLGKYKSKRGKKK